MADIIIVLSDTHVGSKVALLKPTVNLDDGTEFIASQTQRWLWNNFISFVDDVKKLSKGKKITLILLGDIIEGDYKKRTHQIISRNPNVLLSMAVETLEPLINISKEVYVVRGTMAHVGMSGELEEAFASDINAMQTPNKEHSWYQLLLQYDNTIFDLAHHGATVSPNDRTTLNGVSALATSKQKEYLERKIYGTDVYVLRGHVHKARDTYDNYKPVRVLTCPAWQTATDYSYTLPNFRVSDIGGYIFIRQKDGKYDIIKKFYELPKQQIIRK